MKLTKYEHACLTVEKDGKLLVVDPGAYTTDLPALESVIAITSVTSFGRRSISSIVSPMLGWDVVVYAPILLAPRADGRPG